MLHLSRRHGYVYFKPQIDEFRRKWAELSDREEQIRFVQECQKNTRACIDVSPAPNFTIAIYHIDRLC